MIHDDPRVEPSQRWSISPVFDGAPPRNQAWRRQDVSESDWMIRIPPDCLQEVDAVVQSLRAHPVPALVLTPGDLAMPACGRLMAQVKSVLDDGIGFAVLDRLPVDAYDKTELTAIYWLLSQMIARPVAQAFKGTLLYDVHDTGQKTSTRVRADLTSEDLSWHTDYGFNHPPPYIGLLVLRTAARAANPRPRACWPDMRSCGSAHPACCSGSTSLTCGTAKASIPRAIRSAAASDLLRRDRDGAGTVQPRLAARGVPAVGAGDRSGRDGGAEHAARHPVGIENTVEFVLARVRWSS